MQSFEDQDLERERILINDLRDLTEKVNVIYINEISDERRNRQQDLIKKMQKDNLEYNLEIQELKRKMLQKDQLIEEYENALAEYESAYKKEQEKHRRELENMKILTRSYQDHLALLKRQTPDPQKQEENTTAYYNDTLGNESQIFDTSL